MIRLQIIDGSLQISNGAIIILVVPKNSCAIDVLALYDAIPTIVIFNKYLGTSTNIFSQPLDNCEDSTGTPFTIGSFTLFAEENLGFDVVNSIKFGSFFSTITQSAVTINTPKAMTFNTEYFSSGVSVISNSQITVDTDGIYNLQFSAQLDRISTSGVDKVDIWFRKQGIDIPNTNTAVTISGSANQAKVVASWNIYIQLNAGQYVELMYSVTDLQVKLVAEAENLIVPYPATPSIIVTIDKIN
jgi:hypothetical protein